MIYVRCASSARVHFAHMCDSNRMQIVQYNAFVYAQIHNLSLYNACGRANVRPRYKRLKKLTNAHRYSIHTRSHTAASAHDLYMYVNIVCIHTQMPYYIYLLFTVPAAATAEQKRARRRRHTLRTTHKRQRDCRIKLSVTSETYNIYICIYIDNRARTRKILVNILHIKTHTHSIIIRRARLGAPERFPSFRNACTYFTWICIYKSDFL